MWESASALNNAKRENFRLLYAKHVDFVSFILTVALNFMGAIGLRHVCYVNIKYFYGYFYFLIKNLAVVCTYTDLTKNLYLNFYVLVRFY